VAQAQPNPGHLALAQLESHLTGSQSRFTSIDISALVHPAASIPYAALQHGVILVEVNPEQTPLTSISTYVLSGLVGQVLPTLLQATF
jgi:NAD-dependent SIR2 family protein deacetylase